jgi:hypothetical protein
MTIIFEDIMYVSEEQQKVVEKFYWEQNWLLDYQDDKTKTIFLVNWDDSKQMIVDAIKVHKNGEIEHI